MTPGSYARVRRRTHTLWIVCRVHALPVEEEAAGLNAPALALTEGVHELLQLCGALDLEKDLVVVVGHLDVEVFGRCWGILGLFARRRRSLVVGHFRSRFLGGVVESERLSASGGRKAFIATDRLLMCARSLCKSTLGSGDVALKSRSVGL